MKSESAFVLYTNLGLRLYIRMSRAIPLAEKMLKGEHMISYTDFTRYQLLSSLFNKAKQRCVMMRDYTDVPYASAEEYIDFAIEECGILMKVYLSKQMSVDSLCAHIDRCDRASPDDYNAIFLPDYKEDVRQCVMNFENETEDRMDLVLAQILVAVSLGL